MHLILLLQSSCTVNRCQVELQRSLGAPAQQDKFDHLSRDVTAMSRRLESLSKEVEILHMVCMRTKSIETSLTNRNYAYRSIRLKAGP